MARTYKRDSRGRFAGGGGGSGGGGKKATSKPAGSGDGRRGPRGGKVGTRAEQARAKKAQAARSAEFRGKSMAGRGAKAAYKAAQGAARAAGGDMRGASLTERRGLNKAKSAVRNMERTRSTARPSRPSISPLLRQQQREADRASRAARNLTAAMKRESDGPGSKASRSASVSKRAMAIYSGKVDPKKKTRARLTRTVDTFELQKRIKKIRDNTASGGSSRRRR